MKDDLYLKQNGSSGSFKFDSSVAEIFDDMITRSVPGYDLTLKMIGVIAKNAFGNGKGLAYDLGCSLGSSILPILTQSEADVIGVDLSEEMLVKARDNLKAYLNRCSLLNQDISHMEFKECGLIVSNFTLQFLPVNERENILKNCFKSLKAGGMMILSEKVAHTNPSIDKTLINLHHEFKEAQGYSKLEIARKRDAIENILIPETQETHLNRLEEAGFQQVLCWYQCFNFASFLAIKE